MSDLGLLLLHLIGDFVAQNDWMSTKHRNRLALLVHCLTYTAIFAGAFWWSGIDSEIAKWSASIIFLSHVAADWKPFNFGSQWPHKAMVVDQTFHISILFFISFYV